MIENSNNSDYKGEDFKLDKIDSNTKTIDRIEADRLLLKLDNWQIIQEEEIKASMLNKIIVATDYLKILEFVYKVGQMVNKVNHHPDISFGYDYIIISLYTHSIGGLHKNDFTLAAKIDKIEHHVFESDLDENQGYLRSENNKGTGKTVPGVGYNQNNIKIKSDDSNEFGVKDYLRKIEERKIKNEFDEN